VPFFVKTPGLPTIRAFKPSSSPSSFLARNLSVFRRHLSLFFRLVEKRREFEHAFSLWFFARGHEEIEGGFSLLFEAGFFPRELGSLSPGSGFVGSLRVCFLL